MSLSFVYTKLTRGNLFPAVYIDKNWNECCLIESEVSFAYPGSDVDG